MQKSIRKMQQTKPTTAAERKKMGVLVSDYLFADNNMAYLLMMDL